MPTFKKKTATKTETKATPPRPSPPVSDTTAQMNRLKGAGWKLSHIAKAVGISSGAAFNWTKGAEASERFLVQLRALPTTPPAGKPATNKLDHSPRKGRKVVDTAQRDLAELAEANLAELHRIAEAQAAAEYEAKRDLERDLDVMGVPSSMPAAPLAASYGPRTSGTIQVRSREQAEALARVLRLDAGEVERAGQIRFEF